jgi:hypothetical protein
MSNSPSDRTLQVYARLAGFLYLFVMAAFVIPFVIVGSIGVPGDFMQTARNVVGSEDLYRVAIAITLVGCIAILALSGFFYAMLRTVDPGLAAIAFGLRVAEAVFMAFSAMLRLPALVNYAAAADGDGNREVLHRFIFDSVGAATNVAFAFVSIGSTIFFYLFFKSRFIPCWLAGFGVLASLALGALAFALVLAPDQLVGLEMAAMLPLGIAEVTTGLWLLIAGANLSAHRQETGG